MNLAGWVLGVAPGLFVLALVALRVIAPGRAQGPECGCRNRVPVHIATGEHVANLCTECGRRIYMAKWVFRGE